MITNATRRNALNLLAALAFAVSASSATRAHDAEQGPNGGQIVTVKGHHIELTAKGTDLTIYLSDEAHAALASKGASGRVVILDGSRQSTVQLTAAEPNLLTAKLEAALAAGARVVVSAKLGDNHDVLARFVIK